MFPFFCPYVMVVDLISVLLTPLLVIELLDCRIPEQIVLLVEMLCLSALI